MNKTLLTILSLLLLASTTLCAEKTNLALFLNKHYFSVNETIYFTAFGEQGTPFPDDYSIYISLMKVSQENQELIRLIRIKWKKNHASGHLIIPRNLTTGKYLVGVHISSMIYQYPPVDFEYIHIFNPVLDSDKDVSIENESISSDSSHPIQKDSKYSFSYQIERNSSNPGLFDLNGKIQTESGTTVSAVLSLSIVNSRFYDLNQWNEHPNRDTPGEFQSFYDINFDSISRAENYIHGKFLINGNKATIKKVYLYSYWDGTSYLDKYITDYEGDFRIPEPPFSGNYPVELFAIPENNDNYSFLLKENFYHDSLLQFDLSPYAFQELSDIHNYHIKKYLIDQSYPLGKKDEDEIHSQPVFGDELISDRIILDEYVLFPTLAETIREIIPQVNIKYRKEAYEIRIYDQRAKNYCCDDNPLIFINNEPFPDPNLIMDINTRDINSIEVIRPIEAIHNFGDIGINGILKINLNDEVPVPDVESPWKSTFTIAGFQENEPYQAPDLPENYPDFRNFIYWSGDLKTDSTGTIQFSFLPSNLEGQFIIIIRGISASGELISLNVPLKFNE